ncbi:hypothetical protein SK128_012731 [Halocaridina rubra]|uniref:peptidyl-tRNA hydrolase n=1 Tax=Halocaridina rubra TaxID=373956 RepID=A0AAN8ZUP2_HALRR
MSNASAKNSPMEDISLTNISLMATCFIAGLYIGRKLNSASRRISSLISVGPSKLALVIRDDLKMTKGKIAAQCSHGTLVAYRTMERSNPGLLQAWLDVGQPKIVLRAVDAHHLQELNAEAKNAGLQTVLVADAGKTQVPQGTETVLAVGPASTADIDKVTGSLKLL